MLKKLYCLGYWLNMMLKRQIKNCMMAILIVLTSACATKQVANLDPHFSAELVSFKVIDQRAPEISNSFLTKTGNIYSCHYGIYLIENNQIAPERLDYFVHVLNKNGADTLNGKTLKVERFTIYRNVNVETMRGATFGILGGAVGGGAIASATDKTSDGIPLASADWDTAGNPTDKNSKPSNLIGCEEAYSGSYWASELKGGVAPFILYLDASIDNTSYKLRMVQPTTQMGLSANQSAEQLRLGIDRLSQEFLKHSKTMKGSN